MISVLCQLGCTSCLGLSPGIFLPENSLKISIEFAKNVNRQQSMPLVGSMVQSLPYMTITIFSNADFANAK